MRAHVRTETLNLRGGIWCFSVPASFDVCAKLSCGVLRCNLRWGSNPLFFFPSLSARTPALSSELCQAEPMSQQRQEMRVMMVMVMMRVCMGSTVANARVTHSAASIQPSISPLSMPSLHSDVHPSGMFSSNSLTCPSSSLFQRCTSLSKLGTLFL